MQFESIRDLGTKVVIDYRKSDRDSDSDPNPQEYEVFLCDNYYNRKKNRVSFETAIFSSLISNPRLPEDQKIIEKNMFFLSYLEYMDDISYPLDRLCLENRVVGDGENEGLIFELISFYYDQEEEDEDCIIIGVRDAKSGILLAASRKNWKFDGRLISYRGTVYLIRGSKTHPLLYREGRIIDGEDLHYNHIFRDKFVLSIDTLSSSPTIVIYNEEYILGRYGKLDFIEPKESEFFFEKDISDIAEELDWNVIKRREKFSAGVGAIQQ